MNIPWICLYHGIVLLPLLFLENSVISICLFFFFWLLLREFHRALSALLKRSLSWMAQILNSSSLHRQLVVSPCAHYFISTSIKNHLPTTKYCENLLQLQTPFVSATLILWFSAHTVTSLFSLSSRSFITTLSNTSLNTDPPGIPLVITLH